MLTVSDRIAMEWLGCGSMDLGSLERLLESFDLDIGDVIEHYEDLYPEKEERKFNSLVFSLYDLALINACDEVGIDYDEVEVDIDVNYMVNCLDIKTADGYEGVHDKNELVERLEQVKEELEAAE